jgi:aminomethyltransferase
MEVLARRIAREGDEIFVEGRKVGAVTSGTFSPTLKKPIAMAYVEPTWSNVGQESTVLVRGRQEPAKIVALPFYRRPRNTKERT